MASLLPTKLKAAAPDVGRFATRAAQLEKLRPIVAYWCEYYILQQILNRQLHTTNDECTNYALQLMDKLEAYKVENATNDAIVDDVAAKAYIENFALETFNKADVAQRNNRVTKSTADTFQASATFIDVLNIWAPLEPDLAAKSKFAKFHALRIAKAIKAGEDPNASNPVVEQPAVPPPGPADYDIEADLQELESCAGGYQPPSVSSVPHSQAPSRPQSTVRTSPLPSPLPPKDLQGYDATLPVAEPDVSPIEPAYPIGSKTGWTGGGYFPSVPHSSSGTHEEAAAVEASPPTTPSFVLSDPAGFYGAPSVPPPAPTPHELDHLPQPQLDRPPQYHQTAAQPVVPAMYSPSPQAAPATQPQIPIPLPAVASGPPPRGYKADDDSILAAQKHAKWAVSALNFEDVETAVKELRIALQSLGAS